MFPFLSPKLLLFSTKTWEIYGILSVLIFEKAKIVEIKIMESFLLKKILLCDII